MNESFKRLLANHYRLLALTAAGVLVLLGIFLIASTVAALSHDNKNEAQNTITVTGTGKADAPPTIAHVSFTVEETAPTVAAAQDAANKKATAALAAIKALGIDDKDVQASGYNVNPQYEVPPCAPGALCPRSTGKVTGYQASESVDIKVRDLNKTGNVIQALGSAGVQNISGPNFQVDDATAVTRDARAKAIENARQNAMELAKELHVHLGDVVSYSDSGSPYPMYASGKAMATDAVMSAPAAPPLPQGQNQTEINVTVTYEIN